MKIFVTGGLSYIGSHTIIKLLEKNYDIVCIDNIINSDLSIKKNIKKIVKKKFKFHNIDPINLYDLKKNLKRYKSINCILHFASLIYAQASSEHPIQYYRNNLNSLLNIVKISKKYNANLIFSSSANAYCNLKKFPTIEDMPLGISSSQYGNTKEIGEEILMGISKIENFSIASLRCFNHIRAHESDLIGERSEKKPTHIMSFTTQVAIGNKKKLTIFGNNYKTKNRTYIGDFIHVNDVAEAHVKCIPFLEKKKKNFYNFNIGVGKGIYIVELIKQFEKSTEVLIPKKYGKRRKEDVPELWANCEKDKNLLNWSANYNYEYMVLSA